MTKLVSSSEELLLAIENNNEVGNMEITLQDSLQLSFASDIPPIKKPLKINGSNSSLTGQKSGCFLINSSNVEISNIKFYNYNRSIAVDANGSNINNITIKNCGFYDVAGFAIEIVNTKSNSKISNVNITGNDFLGATGDEMGEKNGLKIFLAMGAGKAANGEDVENVELSDVTVTKNTTDGEHRMSVYLCGAIIENRPSEGASNTIPTVINPILRNIEISNNKLHGAWDGTISVSAGFAHQKNAVCENINITNNDITHGLYGIYVIGIVSFFGKTDTGKVKNINILRNKITGNPRANPHFVGETQYAISCAGARSGTLPNVYIENIGVEKIRIEANEIFDVDCAVYLIGDDLLMDEENTVMKNCYIKDIVIKDNKLYNAKYAFTFCGGFANGEAAHKKCATGTADEDIRTYICDGNKIENLVCENNYVKKNIYKYRFYGALAHGHGIVKNNKILNVKVTGNVFEETKGHIHVANAFLDGWCEDFGGNEVENGIKKLL